MKSGENAGGSSSHHEDVDNGTDDDAGYEGNENGNNKAGQSSESQQCQATRDGDEKGNIGDGIQDGEGRRSSEDGNTVEADESGYGPGPERF